MIILYWTILVDDMEVVCCYSASWGGPPGPQPTPWSACLELDENSAVLGELFLVWPSTGVDCRTFPRPNIRSFSPGVSMTVCHPIERFQRCSTLAKRSR